MKKIFTILFMAVMVASCNTTKKVTYFQDMQHGDTKGITTLENKIKIKPGDKIAVVVNCQDPELTMMFNIAVPNRYLGSENSTSSNASNVATYNVDSFGNIDFPVIGKINVENKTREEIAELIKSELIKRELVLDPHVTVEYINQQITVLGEVNSPGKKNIDRDAITIIDAIAMAGDLKIEGTRNDVTVIRQEGDEQKMYQIDLTSATDIYSSPAYYLQQNDIVYVKPNAKRAGQATINSNTMRSTSFWMSLASFVMALVTFIDNR